MAEEKKTTTAKTSKVSADKKTTKATVAKTTEKTKVEKSATSKASKPAVKKETAAKTATTKVVKEVKAAKTPSVKVQKKPVEKNKAEDVKKIRVILIKSPIGYNKKQARIVKTLGLGKINSSYEIVDNECVRGMIFKVKHLVRVEEV